MNASALKIVKHREERVLLAFGYKFQLHDTETLTSVVGLHIFRTTDAGHEDVTPTFITTPEDIKVSDDGKAVWAWFSAADPSTQLAGVYRIKVVAETSTGQRLVCMDSNNEVPYLIISNSPLE